MFCLASQRGHVGLAKSALRAMADKSDTPYPKVTKLTPNLAAHVTLPYLLGLFNAVLFHSTRGDDPDDDGRLQHTSWKAIAEKFTPVIG